MAGDTPETTTPTSPAGSALVFAAVFVHADVVTIGNAAVTAVMAVVEC